METAAVFEINYLERFGREVTAAPPDALQPGMLARLCAGHGAEEIACLDGIRMSTVRTHIKNVRQKTGSSSIREVVHRVSRMPQIVSALRLVD